MKVTLYFQSYTIALEEIYLPRYYSDTTMPVSAFISHERCLLFRKENIPGGTGGITLGRQNQKSKITLVIFAEDILEESN